MDATKPRAIYLSPGDPWNSPRGGQTAFAKQTLNALGARFAVVSPSEDSTVPVGRWFLGKWNGAPIWRFNIGSFAPKNKSALPLIPRRIVYRRLIKKYLTEIRTLDVFNLFCDSPELLDVVNRYPWSSVCYRFAGLSNPIEYSRYKRLRFLAGWFHSYMMNNLAKLRPNLLLASADRETIDNYERDNSKLLTSRLVFFPTRFDPNVFFPGDRGKELAGLNWNARYPRLTLVGRLCWIKGWRLALETLRILKTRFPNVLLTFVGDGEDRGSLEQAVMDMDLANNVRLEGFLSPSEVRRRLVASDAYLVASLKEGWSVATVEALACGKVIVTTNVSGARDMVQDGVNGYVVEERDAGLFAMAVEKSLKLSRPETGTNDTSVALSRQFSLDFLADDWKNLWPVLKTSDDEV